MKRYYRESDGDLYDRQTGQYITILNERVDYNADEYVINNGMERIPRDEVEETRKTEGNPNMAKSRRARGPRKPSNAVQSTLPGTEEGLPKIPESIRRLLPDHLATIIRRSKLSKKEVDQRKEIGDLMVKHEIKKVPLDNGAFLVLDHVEENKVRYVAPKPKKKDPRMKAQQSEESESEPESEDE